MAAVDIFVGNFTLVDFDLYDLWLGGYSAHEAVLHIQKSGIHQSMNVSMEIVYSDLQDQYRLFFNLEKLLKNPLKLVDQQIYQIDPDTQRQLIQRYYQFDASVVREILGKKLSSRNRKDLDDVSEKTKVALRSCRRQFDNLKRLFKTVEDMMGSLVENIQTNYLLSEDLAREYAAIVFIANNRFETGKKKLSHLRFEDFVFCANLMITKWSYSARECRHHEDMDVDLDRAFLQELRDLKLLLEKENMDEHKSFVMQKMRPNLSRSVLKDLDDNFKNYSKAIINIAYGLNHSKEAKDIFIDIVEKVTEPWYQAGWSKEEAKSFLTVYKNTIRQMEVFKYQSICEVLDLFDVDMDYYNGDYSFLGNGDIWIDEVSLYLNFNAVPLCVVQIFQCDHNLNLWSSKTNVRLSNFGDQTCNSFVRFPSELEQDLKLENLS